MKTTQEKIAELEKLSIQELPKQLSDNEYWLTKGEIYAAKLALEVIRQQELEIKVLKQTSSRRLDRIKALETLKRIE